MRSLLITLSLGVGISLVVAKPPKVLDDVEEGLSDKFRRNREKFEALSKDPNAKPNFKITRKSAGPKSVGAGRLDEEPSSLNEAVSRRISAETGSMAVDGDKSSFVALPDTLARVEFSQPILDEQFVAQVKDKKVKLESCQVEDAGADVYVTCVIRVARIEKSVSQTVTLSYTTDDWNTKEDVKAFMMPEETDDGWSHRYETTIKVKRQPTGHKLTFTIKYTVDGTSDFSDEGDYSIKID